MTRLAFLAFGANLGEREQTWHTVLRRLSALPTSQIVTTSPLYETEPVGGPPQPPYLNAVIGLKTDFSPQSLLAVLQSLEMEMGRTHDIPWGPRTLDLDLLLMDQLILSEQHPLVLQLPHPRMHLRRFVLQPLADIAPHFFHPQQQMSIQALLKACPDRSSVVLYPLRIGKNPPNMETQR